MLIGALPLGFAFYFVFVPPAGLSETGLFFWLTGFVLLTRVLMTFFFVPWAAIAAELTDDYAERTSVMSFRFAIGWLIGISFPLFVLTVLMPSTAGASNRPTRWHPLSGDGVVRRNSAVGRGAGDDAADVARNSVSAPARHRTR